MENKTQILQIGMENWSSLLNADQKKKLEWHFLDLAHLSVASVKKIRDLKKRGTFDGVLCTEEIENWVLDSLSPKIEAYSLIVDEKLEESVSAEIRKAKRPLFMALFDKDKVIKTLKDSFFNGQGGSTLHTNVIMVHPHFKGNKTTYGESFLRLEGNYQDYEQTTLLSWQQNMGFINQQSRKLYLQYEHDEGVEIYFDVEILSAGSQKILDRRSYDESAITEGINIQYEEGFSALSFSLRAKGEGKLDVGILHIQDSRNGYGEYFLGGKRISDASHQDFYYYFNPGDLKPPLSVYFAGYHSGKGFEGFFRMKKAGNPFLLITDSRLEGGAFYMGSPEYEAKIIEVIEDSLSYLNFSHHDLILAGLSMGTFGALYYAKDLSPHAVVVGKPLLNVGDIAQNERLIRPGGFSTAYDIQFSLIRSLSEKGSQALNDRFWSKFDQGSYEATSFIIAHMLNDDYDARAYGQLQEHLIRKKSQLIGKGIPGRHNDNSSAINEWFFGQLQRLLRENFGRMEEHGL